MAHTVWVILMLVYKTSLRYIFHQHSNHHTTMGSTKFKMTKLTRKIHVSIVVKFGKCSEMFLHSSKSHFQESYQEKFQVHKNFPSILISILKVQCILGSSCGCVPFGFFSRSGPLSCCHNIFNNQGLWRNLLHCFILFGKCYFGSIFIRIYSSTLVLRDSWSFQRLKRNGSHTWSAHFLQVVKTVVDCRAMNRTSAICSSILPNFGPNDTYSNNNSLLSRSSRRRWQWSSSSCNISFASIKISSSCSNDESRSTRKLMETSWWRSLNSLQRISHGNLPWLIDPCFLKNGFDQIDKI